jgi:hypothetical protein
MDEQLRFILLLGLIMIFTENTGAFAICMFSENGRKLSHACVAGSPQKKPSASPSMAL